MPKRPIEDIDQKYFINQEVNIFEMEAEMDGLIAQYFEGLIGKEEYEIRYDSLNKTLNNEKAMLPAGYYDSYNRKFRPAQLRDFMNRTDLMEISHIYNVKVGRENSGSFTGNCPFCGSRHKFKIDRQSQSFYCYRCKQTGNTIKFISLMENIKYTDAATVLAFFLGDNSLKEDTAQSFQIEKRDEAAAKIAQRLQLKYDEKYKNNRKIKYFKYYHDLLMQEKERIILENQIHDYLYGEDEVIPEEVPAIEVIEMSIDEETNDEPVVQEKTSPRGYVLKLLRKILK